MTNRDDLTVISPVNDGESVVIVEICRNLAVDVRVSQQPWGATLDAEPPENLLNLKRDVAIVEMPSKRLEDDLASRGHRVFVVDHHLYTKLDLDRRHPLSSLEQIAQLLGYMLNRMEQGIAINDRSYIFGLLEAGYSIEEIREIRKFDLQAQGIPSDHIKIVEDALKTAPVQSGITILHIDLPRAGFAQDFLVLQDPTRVKDLLILSGNPVQKANFYGDPQKVEKLLDIGEWSGGSGKSNFWGTTRPDVPEIFRRLGIRD